MTQEYFSKQCGVHDTMFKNEQKRKKWEESVSSLDKALRQNSYANEP